MSEKTIEILEKIGLAALILAVGYIVILIILRILKKALRHTTLDGALHSFIVNLTKILLLILLAVMMLGFLNVPTGPLITVLGAAGVAVALAMRDSLSNFVGGILILISKPYSKGDYIEDLEIAGQVEKIDLLYTTLKTPDNKVIIIPNGKLANATVINYSREPVRRLDCKFRIDYEDDIRKAMEILREVAWSDDRILQDPEPVIGMASQEGRHVIIDVKVWVGTEDYVEVGYYLQEQVKLAFDEAGIIVPFPQMEIRLKK